MLYFRLLHFFLLLLYFLVLLLLLFLLLLLHFFLLLLYFLFLCLYHCCSCCCCFFCNCCCSCFFSCCCLFSGEPCFQERPIRFRILRPSPFIHTERHVTGPCRKLLARYFGSPGSSQSQRPAERRVPRSFYCSSTPESELKDIVPSYDIFVTQRAPLGSASRQCYCVFQQQLQLEGVQPHVLRKLCFSTAASTLTPGWRGGLHSFPSGFGDAIFPSVAHHSTGSFDRRGGFLLHLSSITPKPRSLFPFSPPRKEEEELGFNPGSNLLSFWKRGRYGCFCCCCCFYCCCCCC